MRKIFLLMDVSLDGYFEQAGHDISGFKADFEVFYAENSPQVDTMLLGRRTYEMFKNFWPTPQAQAVAPEIARFINENQKVVVSHHDFDPGWEQVTVIHTDVINAIRQLKAQPGQTIAIFGSNTLAVSLLEAGLLDEVQLLLNPVAFGAGTSLFKGLAGKAEFTLIDLQRFQSGKVLLTYQPCL